MTINLYTNTSDKKRMTKSIKSVGTYTIHLKEPTTVENPGITLSGVTLGQLAQVNYAYIPEFKRYYFVSDKRADSASHITLDLNVDVLMSYKSEILSLQAIIQRQENKYNLYLDDGSFMVYANNLIQTLEFPNGFNDDDVSYIITILGGEH